MGGITSRRSNAKVLFQAVGHSYQIGKGVRLHFLHNAATMDLNRGFTEVKLPCDLLVRQTLGDEAHHLDFAVCEFGKSLVKVGVFCSRLQEVPVSLQPAVNS